MNNKSVLIATWSDRPKEPYTTIGQFCKHNPGYSKHTIHSWLSRHKKPFMHEGLILEKLYFKQNT